jgi:SAM-dependent methyltransferase
MTEKSNRENQANVDTRVVEDFGKEWKAFNQKEFTGQDLQNAFNQYFDVFPFENIGKNSVGFDMGCGSGRWAKLIAPRVKELNCVDPSAVALEQAKNNLENLVNCNFECASVSDSRIANGSQDFGYCLGVLHHIPDTKAGLESCANKLKPGAPFLLYLYYRFDNKPLWFRLVWKLSDLVRKIVSGLPFPIEVFVSRVIAIFIYWPLSRLSLLLESIGMNVSNIPLSDYRNKPFYFLRTDALDRFGTKLEKRFTKEEILQMMNDVGFSEIKFSTGTPYWVCVGIKV